MCQERGLDAVGQGRILDGVGQGRILDAVGQERGLDAVGHSLYLTPNNCFKNPCKFTKFTSEEKL